MAAINKISRYRKVIPGNPLRDARGYSRVNTHAGASLVRASSPWEFESCPHLEHLSKPRAFLPLGSSTNRGAIPPREQVLAMANIVRKFGDRKRKESARRI